MNEISTPAKLDIDPNLSISDFLLRHATDTPSKTLMCREVAGEWQDIPASEVLQTVRGIAKGLIAHGYGKGDAIAIIAAESQTLADQAAELVKAEFEPRPVVSMSLIHISEPTRPY